MGDILQAGNLGTDKFKLRHYHIFQTETVLEF